MQDEGKMDVKCFVLIMALSCAPLVYPKSSMPLIEETDAQERECIPDEISGIPFWVCLNSVRRDVFPNIRQVLVFLESKNFSLDNVRRILLHLSAEFNEPEMLGVSICSDREKLQRWANIYKHLGKREGREVELAEADYSARLGCLRADYLRTEAEARLYFYPDPNNEEGIEEVLKSSSSKFKAIGSTASDLMRASKLGIIEEVKKILDQGVDVNVKDKYGYTALINAILSRQDEVAIILLQRGADVNLKGPDGLSPLMYALSISRLNDAGIAEELLTKGADVKARSNSGETVLTLAIKKGQTRIVEELLKRGVEVNVKDQYGKAATEIAEDNGLKEIIRLLKMAAPKEK